MPNKTTERDTFSWSVFGLVGYDITEQLRFTLEARYIRDDIEVTTNTAIDRVSQYILNLPIDFSFGAPPVLPATDDQTSDTINPRVALDYKLTEDVMFYGSVAKGTQPAGFGTSQFATPQNARIDQDRQVGVTVTDPNTFWPAAGIVNAAEAETKGVEVELVWRVIDPPDARPGLRLHGRRVDRLQLLGDPGCERWRDGKGPGDLRQRDR